MVTCNIALLVPRYPALGDATPKRDEVAMIRSLTGRPRMQGALLFEGPWSRAGDDLGLPPYTIASYPFREPISRARAHRALAITVRLRASSSGWNERWRRIRATRCGCGTASRRADLRHLRGSLRRTRALAALSSPLLPTRFIPDCSGGLRRLRRMSLGMRLSKNSLNRRHRPLCLRPCRRLIDIVSSA